MKEQPVSRHEAARRDRENLITQAFVTLADTLVDDYDIVDMLDRLVRSCVQLLHVSQAGLMLLDQHGSLRLMASSSEETRLVELFQLQGTEGGPCVEAARTGATVSVDDLSTAKRWPRFTETALSYGFHSVHAVPMRLREETIGALNLFPGSGPGLTEEDKRLARGLTDVATIGILQQRTIQRSSLLTEQLQSALDSRLVIEQAKGLIAASAGLEMDAAFGLLRAFCRDRNLKLGQVAEALSGRTLTVADLVAAGRPPGPA